MVLMTMVASDDGADDDGADDDDDGADDDGDADDDCDKHLWLSSSLVVYHQ